MENINYTFIHLRSSNAVLITRGLFPIQQGSEIFPQNFPRLVRRVGFVLSHIANYQGYQLIAAR